MGSAEVCGHAGGERGSGRAAVRARSAGGAARAEGGVGSPVGCDGASVTRHWTDSCCQIF